MQYHLDERETAHVLALMHMAAFDAIVASHEAKFFYWLLRPIQADPLITLAIGMPSFPSYPSNHAAISAAATAVLGAMFPNERRGLDAQADEAALSRIFGGIHYRLDSDAGLVLGRTIAAYALARDVAGHRPFVLDKVTRGRYSAGRQVKPLQAMLMPVPTSQCNVGQDQFFLSAVEIPARRC